VPRISPAGGFGKQGTRRCRECGDVIDIVEESERSMSGISRGTGSLRIVGDGMGKGKRARDLPTTLPASAERYCAVRCTAEGGAWGRWGASWLLWSSLCSRCSLRSGRVRLPAEAPER
jgi:hypothetical protein